MAIERKTIKTLTGGVSQQPHALRRDNQCTEQVNFLSDPIKGLVRRPGSKFMGNAPTPAPGLNSSPANTFTHIINRDDDTQLLFSVIYSPFGSAPSMGLYDMQTGAEIDIKNAAGTADATADYLATTSTAFTPGTPYEAVTIADHTFVLNRSKTVTLTSNHSHSTGNYNNKFGKRGMIFVKEGAYNAEYSVTAVDNDGSVRKLRVTTSGGLSGGEKDSKTDNIAAAIEWGLSADGKTLSGTNYFGTGHGNDESTRIQMTVHDDGINVTNPATHRTFNNGATHQIDFEIEGSVVSWFDNYLTQALYDASPIKVEVSDSYGDTLTSGISNTRESFEGLPVVAPNNYLLKIEGAPESKLDDYYVLFVADDPTSAPSDLGRGQWEETMGGIEYYELDEETMPYKLVKFSDTEYRWMPGEWEDKTVGDSATDPEPAFVQNTISDLFFFKGRLGFLTGETMVMSELDNPFNFWRTTTSQVLATDRISVSSSVNEITVFNYAVPFSNQLILFSDRTQFIVNYGSGGLTPMTTSLALISRYESSRFARPVSNDNSVIFAQRRSTSTAIYEMYPTGATDLSFEAKNISEQINNYIVGEVVKIETSSLAGAVVVQTDLQDNLLYVYRYYDRARERIVSSWSRYEMGCSYVHSYFFVGDVMRVLDVTLPISGGFGGAKVAFNELRFDNTASLPFSVDGYYTFASGDISWDNTDTTLTVPWSPEALGNADEFSFIVFDDTGVVYTTGTTTSTTVVVPGVDLTGLNVTIGMKFTSTYTFSHQYLRGGEGGKESLAITDGRTTVKWVEVYLEDTQHIKAEVSFPTEVNKTSSSKTFSGTAAGGIDYGDRESEGSYLRLFVGARNDVPTITLSSDTHEAATVVGASFEMIHTSRLSRTS